MVTDASAGGLPGRLRAPGVSRWWGDNGPVVAGMVMMALGILLRAGTFTYGGAFSQPAFNTFTYGHIGAYSDIASLFFRDRMWHHVLPYVHYPFEYPVGTGLFAWLTSLPVSSVGGYLAVNAVLLAGCGALTIWLMRKLPGANPWLLALSPTLALYVVLNWDLVSIAALVVALVLFERRRDGWGSVALGVATWTKLFPIIALPIILWARLLEGRNAHERTRSAGWLLLPFAATTLVFNAPFMFSSGAHGGLVVSSGWFYFFRFNATRGVGGSLWSLVSNGHMPAATANPASAALTIAGVLVILGAMAWASRRRGVSADRLIAAAALGCFAWFFFSIKSYSPQYDLWVIVLFASAGGPAVLAVAFSAADVAFFAAAFTHLRLRPHDQWFLTHVLRPSLAVREGALLAVVLWAIWSILAPRVRRSPALPIVEPEPLVVLTSAQE